MKMLLTKKSNQKGYAILFTVVVVSIILTIAIGMSNSSYKQLVLSSVARDSQAAFFESDTAAECALYADAVAAIFSPATASPSTYACSVDKNGTNYLLSFTSVITGSEEQYSLLPSGSWATSLDPCPVIYVQKTIATDPIVTTMQTKGYNICTKTSPRTVEREINITY